MLATSLRSVALRLSIVSTAVFLALPVAAVARPQRMDDPGTQFPEFAGDANHMPVNCVATPQELLAHARGIRAVREAMNEFDRRGYVPIPEFDVGANGCPEPMSFAGFAYRRQVSWLDSTHAVLPLILVATRLNPWTGEPLTTVTAGLAVRDLERGVTFSGDSLGTLEPSFDVKAHAGGGRGVLPESMFLLVSQSTFNLLMNSEALARCMREHPVLPCPPLGYPLVPCFNWESIAICFREPPVLRWFF